MKTVYLHIGPPKTGTTAIQNFLHTNRDKLARHGYLYAETGLDFTGHHVFAASLLQNNFNSENGKIVFTENSRQQMYQRLVDEISNADQDKAIISSEILWKITDHKSCKKVLEIFNIKVILYLRRQDYAIASRYGSIINHGGEFNALSQFINETRDFYLYGDVLDKLASVYGRENLTIKRYEPDLLKNNDSIDDFLDILGIQSKDLFYPLKRKSNHSFDLDYIEFLRRLNCVNGDRISIKDTSRLLKKITKNQKSEPEFTVHDLLSPEERLSLLKYFEEDNNYVAKEYFNMAPGENLFAPPSPTNWKEFQGLTEERIFEIMGEIIAKYQEVISSQDIPVSRKKHDDH